jgi:hypothetical protein
MFQNEGGACGFGCLLGGKLVLRGLRLHLLQLKLHLGDQRLHARQIGHGAGGFSGLLLGLDPCSDHQRLERFDIRGKRIGYIRHGETESHIGPRVIASCMTHKQ